MNNLASKIRQIRKDNNLTQTELGNMLGYHKSMINKIELGQRELPLDKIQILIDKKLIKPSNVFENEKLEKIYNKFSQPNTDNLYPKNGVRFMTNIKASITRPNIIAGDFSYYTGEDFESRVTHHYEFLGDKLIIGKFTQIGANVEIIMNGANHQMNACSTFPFYVMDGWKQNPPEISDLPFKGDTIIGNDVWIGQNVTFYLVCILEMVRLLLLIV